jgi:tetratricopeptide (TPR) repeat protein
MWKLLITLVICLSSPAAFAAGASVPPDAVQQSREHQMLAEALSRDGDMDGALYETEKSIRLDPKNAAAHALRGWLLGLDGQYRATIAEEKIAIQLEPSNPAPYITLGLALASIGDYSGAIVANEKAIELDRNNLRAYVNLGATLGRKGDYAGAASVYRKVLRMKPNSVAGHLGLGAALGKIGDVKGQVENFKEAVALAPQNDNAHGKLGWALYRAGDVQGALKEGSIANWIRLQRSGPEYLQNFLSLWAGVFLLFGVIFAEIIFGARFKPQADEKIRTSFFMVFHKDRPGRLVITDKRAVFVPEAFSRWFGAQQVELPREGLMVSRIPARKNSFIVSAGERALEMTAPPFVLTPLMKRLNTGTQQMQTVSENILAQAGEEKAASE